MILRAWTSLKNRRQLGQDADFDELGTWIEDNVYGSSMGFVRLSVLWEDVLANIPDLRLGGLRVLDAGGGSGRTAVRIAQLGNEVVLCDPSQEMLDRARVAIQEAQLGEVITLVQGNIQDLERTVDGLFDVVMCHAVLEWLAEPEGALAHLDRMLEPNGRLSLMFYNHNAWLLRHVLSGDFREAWVHADGGAGPVLYEDRLRFRRLSRLPSGWSSRGWGNEPAPLRADVVREWLKALGHNVESKAGIRIFHDYLSEAERTPERIDELVAIEKLLRSKEPFASLGQLTHLVSARARSQRS
jgi:S-adenosylmethionine-dependent methyltransferase